MRFAIAATLDEALERMAAGARPIAGGTDLVVSARHGSASLPDDLVAIDRLDELRQVEQGGSSLAIGALVSHATVMAHPLVVEHTPGLADASALVGSPSTRHLGTLGGNVMNASPAMDTGAPLLALGASARLASVRGTRTIELADLWTGPGTTSAAADELLAAIDVPMPARRSSSAYIRLEYRRSMEIAVVGAGAAVTLSGDGSVASAELALTAVAPTIVRVDGLDVGKMSAEAASEAARSAAVERATPISDLRASDRYRRHTIGVMAARAVDAAARRAAGEDISIPVNRAEGIGASA